MSFLDKIRICNQWNSDDYGYLYTQSGQILGRPKKDFAEILLNNYGRVFDELGAYKLRINRKFDTLEARSKVLYEILFDLQKKYQYFPLWRGELWRSSIEFDFPAEFYIERGCVAYFGVKAWGIHVNGYVQKPDGLYMWVALRSSKKAAWPKRLDQIVGGGQPAGLTPMENVIKEAAEEAGIPHELAIKAESKNNLNYIVEWDGLHNDEMFVFDLQLPEDFTPTPVDGEVESFHLMPIEEVAKIVEQTYEYKDNSALVMIDFLIRHGYLTAAHPDFYAIKRELYAKPSNSVRINSTIFL